MNYLHIFIASQVIILALCVLIPICQAIGRSAKEARAEREAEAQRAECERAAAERKAEADAKQAETERRRAIRKQETEAKRAERLEAARQLAEYKRQAVEAEKELRSLKHSPHPSPAATPSHQGEGSTAPAPRRPIIRGNNAFRGERVAFTGTLKDRTRREAIQAVADNGGRAFEDMPAGTTMLIVGGKPGKTKLDKARQWGVRILTETDFESFLNLPVTVTPDEFAAVYAA